MVLATAGIDYTAKSGTIVFAPGETTQIIDVSLLGDNLDEITEAFSLELTNPDNVSLADERAVVTIVDNDEPPSVIISDTSITEGNNAVFTISLSEVSSKTISVDYSTADGLPRDGGMATAGFDYEAKSGTVTFAPGETTKTIEVTVKEDATDELNEAFSLNLSNAINATITDSEASATIEDNDNPPQLSVGSISVIEGDEGATVATVNVSLDAPSSLTVTVDYATTDGTAIAGIDYQEINGTLTFAPGETSKTIEVSILGDSLDEITEAFSLSLSNPTNVTLVASSSTVTIEDNDLPPLVEIADTAITEGDEGTTNVSFTVNLSQPSSKVINIDYRTIDGTAIAGVDYQHKSGTLTFAPGETTKTIEVAVRGDTLDEIDEAFSLNLSNPSNVTIADGEGIATISDNDTATSISINNVSVTESDAGVNVLFTVTLDNPSGKTISVDYTTVDGTATAGQDYVAKSGTLTFAPGETTQTIEVAISGDSIDEIDEAFSISLENPVNAAISDAEGTATIVDNDTPPEITTTGFTITEGNDGTKEANFTVSLSAISSKPVTVDFATGDNTAIAGFDYVAKSGTLTFAPGELSKNITVEIVGDLLDELDEVFALNLSNPSNGTLANATALGAIADDDLPSAITINSVIIEEGDTDGVNAVFEVSLSAPSNLPITVEYSTLDGTAIAGEDYQASNGTLTFNPGETSKTIVVPIKSDLINENDETFGVRLSDPTNATIAVSQGTATIEDNDSIPQVAIDDTSITENDAGVSTATFTVNLSEALATNATVDFTTADDSAIAGFDYVANSGTVTFASGETTQTIEVEVIGDTVDEVDETFNVNLSNPVNVLIDDGSGSGTIIDDDVLIAEPEGILLAEEDNFRVEYTQSLTIPDASSVLAITYSDLNFDTADTNSINDALEIALIDNDGNSLVHTIGTEQDAFFNLTEGEEARLAPGVTVEGQTIRVNLTDVAPDTVANLVVRLVNNDGDVNTSVRIDSIQIDSGDGSSPVVITDSNIAIPSVTALDLANLTDVSPSLKPQYQQTSFNEETNTLTATLALANEGTYHLDSSLIVVVKNLSDPSVRTISNDGLTSEGLPYYDFTNLLNENQLAPGESTQSRDISFSNPDKVQFTYELAVLSQLNDAPSITSQPDLEIIGGQTYSYQITAEDRDGDTLSYGLLTSPLGMSIDADTGLISWETTTEDISNHAIVVEVSDGRGGTDLQTFNLSVTEILANRPPQFTTTPVVDAYINQPYEYDADAVDPDLDPIEYEVVSAPEGLTINPDTGEVEWTPPSVVVLGDTVIGQINLPGEVDEFSFSGTVGQQIYFDPLQYSGRNDNWNFDVYAPNGDKIIDTDLRYSNNQLIELPETGNYRVVISTNRSQTGSYGFSVIDLNLTPVAQLDRVIEGKLSPGSEDDIYRFAGNEGQRLFIDKISNSGSGIGWVLYDPQNKAIRSNINMGDMELVLPSDGEYKLALRGRAGFTNTIDYSFEIITPDEVTAPMELGSIDSPKSVYGEITEKGERDFYTFDGKVGQRILFDRLFLNSTRSNSHSINIIDPSGNSILNRNFNNGDYTTPIILSKSGLYQVRIDASGENTGTYSFNLLDLDLATPIDLDTQYSNRLEIGREIHLYQFEGISNQRLFIDSLQTASGYWRLYDSSLRIIGSTSLNSDIELVLDKSDTYYLSISGSSNNPVDYQFELISPDEVTVAIDWNTIVSNTFIEKGERDTFTFTGTKEQRLFIDSLTDNTSNTRFSLFSPSGIKIYSSSIFERDYERRPITLTETGTYKLTMDGLNETREDYSFRLLDVNEATPIEPETNVNGTLNPGKSIQFYKFEATAEERVYFDSQATTSSTVWYLYNAYNRQIAGNGNLNTDWEYIIPADGTYYLMLRGENNAPVDYDFQIVKTIANSTPLVLNQEVTGEISKLGEQDTYTFTGSVGQTIYFDGRGNNGNIFAKIIAPNGTVRYSNNGSTNSSPLTLLEDGVYRVIVDGSSNTLDDYKFAVLDGGNELNLATPYSGTISPRETVLYSFEGMAGQKLDFQSFTEDTNAVWVLNAPMTLTSGNKFVANSINIKNDFERVLPVDGTYLLELKNSSTSSTNFDFQVTDISDTPVTPIGLDAVYEGTTSSTGTSDNYEIIANAGDLIYIDGQLGSASNKGVRLYNPDGSRVLSNNYIQNISSVLLLQQTGSYNLEVYGASHNYRFGVINLKNAPDLAPEIPTEIILAARETLAYQFTGAVGQKLWFDSISATNTTYNARIFNASGRQISSGQDIGLLTLDADGQYYAVIESSGTTKNTINFKLLDAVNAPVLDLDTEIAGSSGASGKKTQVYTFNGNVGQRIYVNERARVSDGNYYLYDRAGKLVQSSRLNSGHEYYELVTDGNYTLVVSGDRTANNDYTVNIVSSEVTETDYTIGDVVTAEISEPGNENVYNFTGTFGQQLWFDALSPSAINARLFAPSGKTVWSQNAGSDKVIVNLEETGTYRLVFDGSSRTVGAYSFRMLDMAEVATDIDLDTVIAGNFGDSTRETQIYRFSGSKGQPLYFNRTVGYSSNRYSVYDLNGTRISSDGLNRDIELNELPRDGEYYLVLEGRGYSGTRNDYSLEIVTPEITTTPYTLGTVVETEIGEAGEKDYYTFSATKGQNLLFDGLGAFSNVSFKLFAPSGRNVLNGGLNGADYWDSLDETGEYTLEIDGSGETTTAYSFRLSDYQEIATGIELDTVITGDFGDSKRETDVYSFEGNEGQDLYFDRTVGYSSNYWKIYDEQNNLVSSRTQLSRDFELALPRTGRYTLHLSGYGNNSSNYSFQIVTPELITTPYTIGDTIVNNISEAGERDTYTFTGEEGQRLLFDSLQSASGVNWQLLSPSGERVFGTQSSYALSSDRTQLLTETGTYILTVDGSGDAVEDYGFRIKDWSSATSIDLNTVITGDFGEGRETNIYQFVATKDTNLYFDRLVGHSSDRWSLYNSEGKIIRNITQLSSDFELTLPTTDNYTLYVSGRDNANNDYSFEVIPSEWSDATLNFDEQIAGTIAVAGERNIYIFDGSIGQQLFFDALEGKSSITAKLYSPTGKLVLDRRTDLDSSLFTLTENGSYRLEVDGLGATTGDYRFNFKDVAAADSLTFNTTISDRSSGREVKLYQFTGTQGTVLDFNLDAASWSNANWKLYDPGNKIIANPSASSPDFSATLPTTGTYTLAVIGNGTEAVDYNFEVTDNTPAPTVNTGLNTGYSGTITAGEIKDNSFTANAGTQIYVDTLLNNNSSIRMRLVAPDGSYVFDNHDSRNDKDVVVLPQTGEYSLQIYGSTSAVSGSYDFQLLELPQNLTSTNTRSLTLGTTVNETVGGLETQVYSFDGKVGQQILFNGIQGNNVGASLITPNGSSVYTQSSYRTTNSGVQTLTQNGIYHLIIRGETTSARDYSFQVLDLNFGNSLQFNQTTSDSLADGRESRIYNFTGKKGDRVGFDFLSGSSNARFKIFAPGNHSLIKNTNTASSSDFSLELPSDGTYTVLIEGGSSSTKIDYSFRAYNFALNETVDVITPGTGENASGDGSLGIIPVTLAAKDDRGAIVTQEYSIRLLPDPDNAAPAITSIPEEKYSLEQEAYRYQIDAIDPDNDTLSYSLIDSPLGAIINSDTGELIWVPEAVVIGNSYEFTVEVTDGRGGSDRQTFSIEVSDKLGTIQGFVFEDLNANGFADSSLLNGEQPDTFFVIDVSGSMGRSSVDWLTADIDRLSQASLSPLDQELGAILTLAELAIEQGRGDNVRLGLITSGESVIDMNPFEPGIQVITEASADYNDNGIIDIREAINGGLGGGGSDTSGIRTAWDLHRALGGNPNIIFMSDGLISVDQQLIADVKADGVNLGAFGFASGGMETMRQVDSEAIFVESFQDIANVLNGFDIRFIGEPLMEGVTVYLDLNNNGVFDADEPSQVSREKDELAASLLESDRNDFNFTFENLVPGTYTVRQVVPNGFIQTAPETDSFVDTVTVGGGESFVHLFGNHKVEPVPNSNPLFTSIVPTDGLAIGNLFRYQATATDPDANLLTYELTLAPEGMSVDPDTGVVVWLPTEEQTGTAQAILRVNDGEGGSDIQFFELEVAEPNIPPVFTSSIAEGVAPQIGKPFQYRAVAVDADLDPVTYELTGSNPNGVAIDSETGKVTWTPASNQLGERTITIKAVDGLGGEAIQTLELEVIQAQPNRDPEITSTPRNNVRIGTSYLYQVNASDPDGNPLSFNLLDAPQSMIIDENGRVVWLPTPEQFGVHSVQLEVTDSQGGRAVQNFEIIASNRASNSLPTITSTPDTRTNIEKVYTYQATATDPDGDLLIWSLDNAPEGMVIDPNTGSISWQPESDQIGTYTVAVRVTDALGAFVGQEFDLSVTGVNTPPQFVSTPVTNGSANQAYTYQAIATDAENDALSYGLGLAPEGMTIDPDTGEISWTPNQGGSYQVEVLAFDPQGGTNEQSYQVEVAAEAIANTPTINITPTIDPDNNPPTIVSTPVTTAEAGQTYSYQVNATDPEEDSLIYGFASRPETMSIDPDTGEIVWTPTLGGDYEVEILVFDDLGARTQQNFTLEVAAQPANTTPTITSTPSYVADVDSPYSYQVAAEDQEGDDLNYELIAAPSGMIIDPVTGAISWNSPVLGQHQVVVGVRDGQAGVAQGYTLTVRQNQAPVINTSNPPNPTATPGEEYRYDVPAFDPNGDPLAYSLDPTSEEKGITIDELGRLRWTPEIEDAGNQSVTVTIIDEAGATVEQNFTIQVVADSNAPLVTLLPGTIFVVDGQYQADLNSSVPFQVRATDNVGVTGLQLLVDNQPVAVDINGIADVTFDQLGFISLKALAYDAAGNIGEATTTVEIFDSSDVDAPTVNIDLGEIEDNIVTEPIEITGTVDDDNLAYYVLEIAPADGSGEFVELYRSETPVSNGVLATFDPSTVANNAYTLRIRAVDNGGNFATSEETVFVEGELKLGNFQLSFTDLTIPVSGIPVNVTRTYDTLTANNRDDFGYGWRLEFRDTNLRTSVGTDEQFDIFGLTSKGFREGDKVYLTLPGGKRETYTFKPQLTQLGAVLAGLAGNAGQAARGKDFGLYEPAFVSESDSNNELKVSNFLLIREEGGQFAGIAGGLYNPANAAYGGRYTLTTGEGIEYEIDAVSGDLLTATDTNGNKLTFSDAGITSDTGVEVRFGRDGQGRITTVIDPDGNEIEYDYDDAGDLISVTDREKNTTRYGYSEDRAHYLDEIIDPLNRPAVRTEYGDDGRLTKIIDTDGDPIEFVYDTDSDVQITKDAFGNPTVHEYDERGNVVRELNALSQETLLEYDDDDNVTKVIDPNGNITEYTYDDNGNVLSRTEPHSPDNPNPEVTRYTYNRFNQNTSVILPTGAVFNQNYDPRGNLLSMTDGDGNIIQAFTYDERGNVTSETDPTGTSLYSNFDVFGNARRVEDSTGEIITSTYDSEGRIITMTDDEGTSTFDYDNSGREIRADYGDGVYVEYDYEGAGTDWTVLDAPTIGHIERNFTDDGKLGGWLTPGGEELTFTYDKAGRLKTEVTPDGTTTYEYDSLGRVKQITDSSTGLITQMHYDELVGIDPDPTVADNLVGQLAARTVILDENTSYTTSYTYYPDGKTKSMTDANNNTWFYEYTATTTTVIDPLGRRTTSVQTDQYLPSQTINPDGTSSSSEYLYSNNLLEGSDYPTRIVDRGGNDREFGYDEEGRLITATDLGDTSYSYTYGDDGLATVQSPTGQDILAYTYDNDGNVKTVTYSDGGVREHTYNAQNELESVILPTGVTIDYTYDDAGVELTRTSSLDGLVTSTRDEDSGQLVSVEDNTGITNYIYDETTNEFLGIDYSNGGSLRYQYDNLSRITGVSVKANAESETYTTSYEYDGVGNLVKVTDPNNGETIMVYDRLNRLVSRSLPNGVTSTYDYQVNTDWVQKITHASNDGTVLASTEYIREGMGEPVKIIREDGSYVEVDYDDSLRVIKEITFDSDDVQTEEIVYTYDAEGNRATVSSGEAEGTYNYDNIHQLIGITTATGDETYTYDAGGRIASITRDGETWNIEYNTADLITLITDSEGNVVVEYEYDSNGRRIEATDSTGSRDYLVAPMGNTELESPHIITDDNGDLISAYVYGGAMPLMRLDEDGNPVYYLTDAMGSVIGLADGSGAEVADFRYDSFGNLRSSTGIEGDREALAGGDFRFQGQWLESTTDLYHFRARYYDPESGRFVSRDPVEIIEYEPESSNPYQFVYNNPRIYSDPSGEISLIEINAGRSLEDVLRAIQNQAISEVKDTIRGYASEVATNLVMSSIKTLLPGTFVGDEINQIGQLFGPSPLGSTGTGVSDIFEDAIRNTVCKIFHKSPLAQRTWITPQVNRLNGKVVDKGRNCHSIYANPSFEEPSSPTNISVVDFIFKDGNPENNRRRDPKAYLIGDIKLTIDQVKSSVEPSKKQWQSIYKYASKYEWTRFALYISFKSSFTGNQNVNLQIQDIREEALDKGIVLFLLNIFD